MKELNYQIGIDLGGTKTEVILLADNNKELYRKRVATKVNTNENYKLVIESIHNLVNLALSKISPTDNYTIGVGIPGTMDKKSGIVQNANTTWLEGHYFKADLEKKIGREIFMDNDANCFTLAESLAGAAIGKKIVFGIIMGTGCGGGLCLDGTIHSGNHGIAGEWGHFSIDPNGEKCFCGNIGCIDTKLTGTGIARAYKNKTGNALSAEIIVQKARENDKICKQIISLNPNLKCYDIF
jgi:fructokinase